MAKNNAYRAEDIEILEGLDPVRKRPGMYIGGTEGLGGLHHLIKEILDNSVDEAMNGHAGNIKVTLHEDGESVTIEDDGRGIPVDIHPKHKKPALEIVLTTLHAGGKFSERNYASAGGLHGVGASVVNALSESLIATVKRDGYEWRQEFSRGKALGPLKRGAKTKQTGTSIFFRPDREIFRSIKFSPDKLERSVQEKAFLNKGLKLYFHNQATNQAQEYCYADGVKSFVQDLLGRNSQTPIGGEVFYLERAPDTSDSIKVEAAFAWTEGTAERVMSYVNGIHTAQGGSHEDGFRSGLSKALRNYISVHDLNAKNLKISGEDIREGMVAVLSANVPGATSQLQFQGQTKDKLNNPEVEAPVDALLKSFENTLNSNPKLAALIVERVQNAAKARNAARLAAESVSRKVGISHRLNLPGKLADCSSNRPGDCELFIVEGDSAGGSAKQARNREFQAVLPLRGKILNTIAAGQSKLKDNKELLDLVSALGCGVAESINLSKLRYGKVVILTDADADGMHIASLLLAFFYRYMRPLIQAGHVYLGMPPLFRIRCGSGVKEQSFWVYSEAERDTVLKSQGKAKDLHITRFKGLGEMNPKTLWETTLDPKTRQLLRVKIDSENHTGILLENLFGKDTSERYRLIQENSGRLEADV